MVSDGDKFKFIAGTLQQFGTPLKIDPNEDDITKSTLNGKIFRLFNIVNVFKLLLKKNGGFYLSDEIIEISNDKYIIVFRLKISFFPSPLKLISDKASLVNLSFFNL